MGQRSFVYLSVDEILELHAVEVGPDMVHDLSRVEACAASPQQTFGGEDLYPTLPEKAAALFFGLNKGHGFRDGNKRIALLATVVFVGLNGCRLMADDATLYGVSLAVAEGEIQQDELMHLVSEWIVEPPDDFE